MRTKNLANVIAAAMEVKRREDTEQIADLTHEVIQLRARLDKPPSAGGPPLTTSDHAELNACKAARDQAVRDRDEIAEAAADLRRQVVKLKDELNAVRNAWARKTNNAPQPRRKGRK